MEPVSGSGIEPSTIDFDYIGVTGVYGVVGVLGASPELRLVLCLFNL